ncbi:MAG: P-loop NTPase, partial [Burkholderiaceae bacterium]
MSITVESATAALARVIDPNTGKDLVSTRSARNLRVDGTKVSLDVELGYPGASQIEPIRAQVVDALKAAGATEVNAAVASRIVAHAVQRGLKVMPNVKNIVAIASGKGGVGKSTVAVNLALALAAEGAKVGVLDADIYGPSQPTMLGITGQPVSRDGKTIEPKENHGLQMSSIGLLIDADQPMVWR